MSFIDPEDRNAFEQMMVRDGFGLVAIAMAIGAVVLVLVMLGS